MMRPGLLCVCVILLLSVVTVQARRELGSHQPNGGVLGEAITIETEPHVLVEAEVSVNECSVNGVAGQCIEQSTCQGTVVAGKCPHDAASVKCCIPHSAAPASAPAPAAPAGAQTCSSGGRSGVCQDVSTCTGSTVSGLCRGAANIKCCLPPVAAHTAAPVSVQSAAPAGAQTCSSGGRQGVCRDVSTCTGSTVSGLCRGAANIKCCLPQVAAPASAPSSSPAAHTGSFAGTGSCSVNGVSGTCGDKNSCHANGGTATSGKCPGAANIQCCTFAASAAPSAAAQDDAAPVVSSCTVNGLLGRCGPRSVCTGSNQRVYTGMCPGSATNVCCITNSAAFRAPAASGGSSRRSRPRIELTTLQRLSETQHLAKWARFKTVRGKSYATQAKEQLAYLNFRQNRVRIIWLNDNYGQGYVVWSSAAPFTDIPASTFSRQRTNLRMPRPGSSHSLLETGSGSDSESETFVPPEWSTPRTEEGSEWTRPEWKSFLEMAEGHFDNDLAAQTLDQQRAEAEKAALVESESEVSVGGARACVKYGRPGFCRLQYTCRTHMEQASDDCPSTHRCCLADKDDLPDDSDSYTNGPVSPKVFAPGTGKVTGTLSIDYRSLIPGIKDQGQCGSCWANAAMAVLEAASSRAGIRAVPLSPQWLVDCNRESPQAQCSGGLPSYAFKFAQTNTPPTTAEYPYTAVPTPTCAMTSGTSGFRVVDTGFGMRCPATAEPASQKCDHPDEAGLLEALRTKGPMAVTMDASNWQAYDGGILPPRACAHSWDSGNHAVTLVGFGEEDGKKFWLIQNSWSTRWGEEGYMRIEAMVGEACGIANYANWATAAPYTPPAATPAAPPAPAQ